MTVRNLPLVGFLGLEANRGPVRYKNCTEADISDDALKSIRQESLDHLKATVESARLLPNSVADLTEEALSTCFDQSQLSTGTRQFYFNFFLGDLSLARGAHCWTVNERYKKARSLFDSDLVIRSLFPILNLISGIGKIIAGITSDGREYSVIEEDCGWKFRATVIAVGIAEICFLGLIVHGIATLYFAMTSLEAQAAQA